MPVQINDRKVHAPFGVGLVVDWRAGYDSDDESRLRHDLIEMVGDRNAGGCQVGQARVEANASLEATRPNNSV